MEKYLLVLEKINQISSNDPEQYFIECNDIIEQDIPAIITLKLSEVLTIQTSAVDISNLWKYTLYMYHILLDIKLLIDKHIECRNYEVIVNAMQISSKFGIEPYLHQAMANHKCFDSIYKSTDVLTEERFHRLNSGLRTFCELLPIIELRKYQELDNILLTFLAGIFSNVQHYSGYFNDKLDKIFEIFSETYFKYLLILKSNQSLPASLQKMLHKELMKRLVSPNGFEYLCKTLILTGNDISEPMWKKSEIVFNIVGRKGHKREFYIAIIDGILNFFRKCLKSKEYGIYVDTCVGSLSRLYSLSGEEIRDKITSLLVGPFELLCTPKEIFAGYIVLDHDQFVELISINSVSFCNSAYVVLPSEILVPYLTVLFQIFSQMHGSSIQDRISSLIVQCLHNREPGELKSIINSLLFDDIINHAHHMHPRIQLNDGNKELNCKISKASDLSFFDASESLIQILKSSNNNILTYNIFMHLFEQLDGNLDISTQSKSDLIENADELTQLMSHVFKKRVALYYSLSELINHKPLYFQFNENPSEVLNICMKIIRRQLTKQESNTDEYDITIIVLSIIKELLEKIKFSARFHEFKKTLIELKVKSKDNGIVDQIDLILTTLNYSAPKPFRRQEKSQYSLAKELCEESKPHLKVYGIMQFIKLIREQKDMETLANKHAVLAISMICLREDDSYTFLNCIKLLVVLVEVLESEVLEMLITEYQSQQNDIDHRLKIGEVIVKVTEGLGPMSYKYKSILINCFLRECTSVVNEIRLSSLSNLSSICRILSYQIHHYFEELMIIIDSIICNDTYVPARRSAVMVITELICAIENLMDFQEILLPVYKTLRNIIEHETDGSTRIHAERGLVHLNSKIKDFLIPKLNEPKEIKIFGIKDEDPVLDKKYRFVDLNIK